MESMPKCQHRLAYADPWIIPETQTLKPRILEALSKVL